ncbi:MAG TPA: transcriptional repressor [bacterium]|nr:transcriptional repressor [bacterium]
MIKTVKYRRSRQRERILQLLRDTDCHPSADWLYEKLKKEFPRLSLGTVYRNVHLLTQQGHLQKIHIGGVPDRFEANLTPHCHLICEKCGKIADVKMPTDDEINRWIKPGKDFTIDRIVIELFGRCPACRNSELK